jgi:hypothetical protein
MSPSPVAAMPVSAVVSLYSESERISLKLPPVQGDPSRKRCVGMRRSRESNPALAAQCDAKRRMILQVPGELMSLHFEASTAGGFANFVGADSEVEWVLSSIAQIEIRQGKSANETLRFILPRKPHGPHLKRHSARIVRAAAAPRIHQQISEPPRSAAIRQAHTNKPDFVTSLARETAISLIESVHRYIILGPGRGSEWSCSGTKLLSRRELQELSQNACLGKHPSSGHFTKGCPMCAPKQDSKTGN